jgi:hypothetical protein
MGQVVVYNHRGIVSNSSVGSGSGGGDVEDILKRLTNVEQSVGDVRIQVGAIAATIPHLATAASVAEILAVTPHLATKADLKAEIGSVRAEIGGVRAEVADVRTAVAKVETKVASMETKIIKWFIATSLTTAGLAFAIAKIIH